MARFSDQKPLFMDHITRAFAPVQRACELATAADQVAVVFAAHAVKYARQWTVDTTEASRRECAKNVALLEESARTGESSRANRALLAYAQSLKAFIACDYRAGIKYADMARTLAR